MADKGSAYSRGEENVNSNFYRNGEGLGTSPMHPAWLFALKHIDAVTAYVKGGCQGTHIGSESVESRLGDIVNYCLILYSILVQEGVLKDPSSPPAKQGPNLRAILHPTPVSDQEISDCAYDAAAELRAIANWRKGAAASFDEADWNFKPKTATEVAVLEENGYQPHGLHVEGHCPECEDSDQLQSRADIEGPVTWDNDSWVWEDQKVGDFFFYTDGRVGELHERDGYDWGIWKMVSAGG